MRGRVCEQLSTGGLRIRDGAEGRLFCSHLETREECAYFSWSISALDKAAGRETQPESEREREGRESTCVKGRRKRQIGIVR